MSFSKGRPLPETRRALICQLLSQYRVPSERALAQAVQELRIPITHTSISRDCRVIGVLLQGGVCGSEPYLTYPGACAPSAPLWYFYARLGSTYYRALRTTADRELLQRARRLTLARQSGDSVTAAELEEAFAAEGAEWWIPTPPEFVHYPPAPPRKPRGRPPIPKHPELTPTPGRPQHQPPESPPAAITSEAEG